MDFEVARFFLNLYPLFLTIICQSKLIFLNSLFKIGTVLFIRNNFSNRFYSFFSITIFFCQKRKENNSKLTEGRFNILISISCVIFYFLKHNLFSYRDKPCRKNLNIHTKTSSSDLANE